MKPIFSWTVTGLLALCGVQLPLGAAVYTKADNTDSLSKGSSWLEGSVPGAADTVRVDSTLTASRTSAVGDDLAVHGIEQAANVAYQWQISNTPDKALTIGAGGISVASGTAGARLILACAVVLGADQTWTLANTNSSAYFQLNGPLTTNGYNLLITAGTPQGTLDLRGSNIFPPNVTLDANVSVNLTGAVVILEGQNTFDNLAVPNGTVYGATIGDYGVASNFGDGGTNGNITLGNTTNAFFHYTGAGASTNRNFIRDRRSTGTVLAVDNPAATLTITGNLSLTTGGNPIGPTNWNFAGPGNLAINGIIRNSTATPNDVTGIVKDGAGTLTLGGDNTFTGDITVNGGGLALAASERIVDTVNLILNGATFSTGGHAETLGTLAIGAGTATIDLGAGTTSSMVFADSSSATWAGQLSVINWNSGDQLRFGTSAAGLTPAQLSAVKVNGQVAQIDDNGYVTPAGSGPYSIYGNSPDTVRFGATWAWNPNLGAIHDGAYPYAYVAAYGDWLYIVADGRTTETGGYFLYDVAHGGYGYTVDSWYPLMVLVSGPSSGMVVDLSIAAR